MLLLRPQALCTSVSIPAVFHFDYVDGTVVELLDSITVTACSLHSYQDVRAIFVPRSLILFSAEWCAVDPLRNPSPQQWRARLLWAAIVMRAANIRLLVTLVSQFVRPQFLQYCCIMFVTSIMHHQAGTQPTLQQ